VGRDGRRSVQGSTAGHRGTLPGLPRKTLNRAPLAASPQGPAGISRSDMGDDHEVRYPSEIGGLCPHSRVSDTLGNYDVALWRKARVLNRDSCSAASDTCFVCSGQWAGLITPSKVEMGKDKETLISRFPRGWPGRARACQGLPGAGKQKYSASLSLSASWLALASLDQGIVESGLEPGEPGRSHSSSLMGWSFRSHRDRGVSTALPGCRASFLPVFPSFRSPNGKAQLPQL
jgi:hypothetical protein